MYNWWEGFGSSSLATLPLGFNCGFISTFACGSSSGVCSWGCPGGLGISPVKARCGSGAAAWFAGVLATPGSQGSWQPGQQEIQCSRRVWQPVLANALQYSFSERPIPEREAWQATVYRVTKSPTQLKLPCTHRRKTFLSGVAVPQWEMTMKVAQVLGLRGLWWCQVCRDRDCLHCLSYGPVRVFFWASCS